MTLPNLVIPGAGKSGTSSLHGYLATHPDIFMSTVKEPHFFNDDKRFPDDLAGYEALFAEGREHAVRGESSTGYFIFPHVPERLHDLIPDCRLVFLLRNPIDRALSHYRWLVGLSIERRDFVTAFEADAHETPDPRKSRGGNYAYYFQEGCYATQLRRYTDLFDPEQILVLYAEKLRADPLGTVNTCATFLGVAPFTVVEQIELNPTAATRYPRLRAFVTGDAQHAAPGAARGRLGRRARRLLGDRVARSIKSGVASTLSRGGPDPAADVDREWLAERYADEVGRLRTDFGLADDVWLADFPLPRAPQ
jgi:hypothetical protein